MQLSPKRLSGKTVLITGASKGIGKAIAIGCAREGASVIVNYNSDRAGAEETAAEIKSLGQNSTIIKANISCVDEIDHMFEQAKAQFPKIDVLINNAGLTGWTELFNITEEKWDEVLNTNLKGSFFCSLAAARWMRITETRGSIINVSTNCAALGVKNLVAYATSKAGLHGMTKQLAVELAPYQIRVNTFAPGPTNVDRNLNDDPDYASAWGSVVPLGRTADPSELIGAALFLASEESSYMTGQVFYVDGGWSIQGHVPQQNMEKAAQKYQ